jgi:hypothetical protein
MSEAENKFTRMIDLARKTQPTEEQAEPQQQPIKSPNSDKTQKERGRPATGKRSNVDYVSTTVFLRKKTKQAAAKLLLGREDLDLSELLENLLADWVSKNS